MSLWRRIAIEKLPELHRKIADADNCFAVWMELGYELSRLYREEFLNESLIARIYEYARWCFSRPNNAYLATAVAVCFYEDIPKDPRARRDTARWLTMEEFELLRPAFAYHLSEAELKVFIREFREQKQKLTEKGRKTSKQ